MPSAPMPLLPLHRPSPAAAAIALEVVRVDPELPSYRRSQRADRGLPDYDQSQQQAELALMAPTVLVSSVPRAHLAPVATAAARPNAFTDSYRVGRGAFVAPRPRLQGSAPAAPRVRRPATPLATKPSWTMPSLHSVLLGTSLVLGTGATFGGIGYAIVNHMDVSAPLHIVIPAISAGVGMGIAAFVVRSAR